MGGRGTRLGGVDKARLRSAPEAPTILDALIAALAPRAARLFLVGRPEQRFPEAATFVADLAPGAGPLGGIATALKHAGDGWCFIVACDLPRFDVAILDGLLAARTSEARCVVPVSSGGLEPLCALYHASLADEALRAVTAGERAVHRFIAAQPHVRWPVPAQLEPALLNVNEPSDLDAAGDHRRV